MALHVPKAPGFMSMLKDGARHFEGMEESVFRNLEACLEIVRTTKSTFGPAGQNKIVINHIGKQFVTNDAATILKELEVFHPAAKLLVMASQQQESEVGDGTNVVFQIAGALLEEARELLRMGLSVPCILDGYDLAKSKALEILNNVVAGEVSDLREYKQVFPIIRTSVASKQPDLADFLAELITKACISIMPHKTFFDVDNIRVLKILGAGVRSSKLIKGMAFRREAEGYVREAKDCKIVVYTCPLDALTTETKGTVLLTSADELTNFSKGEECQMEKCLSSIAASGVKVVVTGGKVGDLALHFANKLGLMVVKLTSKFDLRRLCRATGAQALPQLVAPTAEELGYVKCIRTDEVADADVVIFEQDAHEGSIATLLIRGSTENLMDDIERAIDDGVNSYKVLTRDPRFVAGAGGVECEIARQLTAYAWTLTSLEQYAVRHFALAFEAVPKALAENVGEKATQTMALLKVLHESGKTNSGLIVRNGSDGSVSDAVEAGILDLWLTKYWAINFAVKAACTVLPIDEIIMAKPAGGPKPREPGPMDADD